MTNRCYLRGKSALGLFNSVTGCLFNRVLVVSRDESGEVMGRWFDKATNWQPEESDHRGHPRFFELLDELKELHGHGANFPMWMVVIHNWYKRVCFISSQDSVEPVALKYMASASLHAIISYQQTYWPWWKRAWRGVDTYEDMLDKLADIHERKNAGYAGIGNEDPLANFRASERVGVPAYKGCLVRWSDKYVRISNLVDNPANEQVGESVLDTLLDLAAYCLIAICLYEERDQ